MRMLPASAELERLAPTQRALLAGAVRELASPSVRLLYHRALALSHKQSLVQSSVAGS